MTPPSLFQFAERLRERIFQSADAPLPFEELAPQLFFMQLDCNPALRQVLPHKGLKSSAADWKDLPAVPAAAFKEWDLTCLEPAARSTMFRSSGTTAHRPSRHFHNEASLAVYEASLLTWFYAHFGSSPERGRTVLALTPPPAEAPHSSLVYMFESIRKAEGAPRSRFLGRAQAGGWTVDTDAACAALEAAGDEPLLVLGTALSFVELCEALATTSRQIRLSPAARVLETGGYKGRIRAVPKAELRSRIARALGISSGQIISEYGMSELSSQAYELPGAPESCGFRFPAWARARVISPESGHEVPEGEAGLLRVYDLANVFSVMCIQTEDLAVRRGDGFELLGRASLAEARGCSLMSLQTDP